LQRPIVLLAGRARARQHATNLHRFRAGSSYLYFGGPPVPGAALIVEPGSDGVAGTTLVRQPAEFEESVWTGKPPDDADLARAAGLRDRALMAPDAVHDWLGDRVGSWVGPPCPPTLAWASSVGLEAARPEELEPIIELRLVQDEHEVQAMRRAVQASVDGHLAAMRATRPGATEAHVAAALTGALIARGCGVSFTPIVTTRGEVLHSERYGNVLEDGRLLLVDAGAEEPGGYAADMTRTYPVGGRFSDVQRRLYDVVVRAERVAIASCVPGKRYRDIHDLAAHVLCQGLIEADLVRGDPHELAGRSVHTLFFPHGLGHLIGLDVHDMEDFGDLVGYEAGRARRKAFGSKYLRLDRDLKAGMTVTIEPGLYLAPAIWNNAELVAPFSDVVNRPAVDALLNDRFGGIRVEDMVHVTTGEPDILTRDLPYAADDVTAIVGQPQ
ncbi:MAG: aminopeptidase P N-terminal domain-containing protein, partial [Phycisphaerae bacterium]